jgi:hypothetical protein
MVTVLVFTLLSFLTLSAAYEQLHQLFVYEGTSDRVPASSDGTQEALGHAIARFLTGMPTVNGSNRHICKLTLPDESGVPVDYRVNYHKMPNNVWRVQLQNLQGGEVACATHFTSVACPAPL